jgi:hypothetical protein
MKRQTVGQVLRDLECHALIDRLSKQSVRDWWTRESEADVVRRAEEEGHARRLAKLLHNLPASAPGTAPGDNIPSPAAVPGLRRVK